MVQHLRVPERGVIEEAQGTDDLVCASLDDT
jgi:hypothetical protein